MSLPIEPHPHGALLTIKVQSGALRPGVGPVRGGVLRVRVTEAPERGKANRAVRDLLAMALGVRRRQIELVSGAASSLKRILVMEVTVAELANRLHHIPVDRSSRH